MIKLETSKAKDNFTVDLVKMRLIISNFRLKTFLLQLLMSSVIIITTDIFIWGQTA